MTWLELSAIANEEASAKQGVDLRGNDAAFESAASRNRGTTKLSEWTQ